MRHPPRMIECWSIFALLVVAQALSAQAPQDSAREARYQQLLDGADLVSPPVAALAYTPDHTRLYHSLVESDSIATYSLNLASGEIEPLFDTARLRRAIARALGRDLTGSGTPFTRFRLVDGFDDRIVFSLGGREWTLDLESYEVRPLEDSNGSGDEARAGVIRGGEFGRPDLRETPSPDGTRMATLLERDVAIRNVSRGTTRRITFDATPDHYWGYNGIAREAWAWWSPGGERLAVRKVDMQGVGRFPFVEWLREPPRIEWRRGVHNVRVGQTLPREELHVWHAETERLVRLDTGDPTDAFLNVLGWRPDGSELIVLRVTRDYRDLRILALNPETGSGRIVLAEQFATCFTEPVWAPPLRRYWPLADGKRFLWKSDRDGWGHLYLHDFDSGRVSQLTSGPFEVDDVVGVDEDRGWIYFSARTDSTRPYDVHVHRVRLDGSGFARLTEDPGRYGAELIAGSDYLELWRRRVDGPTELQIRRSDGTLVRTVAAADISRLRASGWTPPEEFTVKAADGHTDLWGVMFRPSDFDPSERYPLVEFIYGGPVVEYTPRAMPYWMFPHALAELGYVVVMLDARGTPGRGRAFLEGGFDRASVVIADHAAALGQLGDRYSYLDLDRVGIVGQSWGANFTTRALLQAPDLYRAGVAVSGGWWSDPERGDVKATVFEQCAVLKQDEPAAPSLDPLEGDLLVIHGTADLNLSGSTDLMWWLDSVIEAGKYIDLMVLPDRPHTILQTDRYVWGAVRRHFQKHLRSRS